MKIGRNDPCLCGSGKKYKHCCLRDDKAQENRTVRQAGWVPLVRFNEGVPREQALAVPAVAVLWWLLGYHAEHAGETGLTTRGHYSRELCRAYVQFFNPSYGREAPERIETSLPLLVRAHYAIVGCGFVTEEGRRSYLTTEGVDVYSKESWDRLFACALKDSLNGGRFGIIWREGLKGRAGRSDFLQDAANFTLYLLHLYPRGTVGELFGRFIQEFPDFMGLAMGGESEESMRGLYSQLFLEGVCVPLRLVRMTEGFESGRLNGPGLGVGYEVTELFRNVFIWPEGADDPSNVH